MHLFNAVINLRGVSTNKTIIDYNMFQYNDCVSKSYLIQCGVPQS